MAFYRRYLFEDWQRREGENKNDQGGIIAKNVFTTRPTFRAVVFRAASPQSATTSTSSPALPSASSAPTQTVPNTDTGALSSSSSNTLQSAAAQSSPPSSNTSASPSATSTKTSSHDDDYYYYPPESSPGLSVGAKAGLGAGIGIGVLLLALLAFISWRLVKGQRAKKAREKARIEEAGNALGKNNPVSDQSSTTAGTDTAKLAAAELESPRSAAVELESPPPPHTAELQGSGAAVEADAGLLPEQLKGMRMRAGLDELGRWLDTTSRTNSVVSPMSRSNLSPMSPRQMSPTSSPPEYSSGDFSGQRDPENAAAIKSATSDMGRNASTASSRSAAPEYSTLDGNSQSIDDVVDGYGGVQVSHTGGRRREISPFQLIAGGVIRYGSTASARTEESTGYASTLGYGGTVETIYEGTSQGVNNQMSDREQDTSDTQLNPEHSEAENYGNNR